MIGRQKHRPSRFESRLESFKCSRLHSASASLEPVYGGIRDVGDLGKHSNAHAKTRTGHPELGGSNHFQRKSPTSCGNSLTKSANSAEL